MTKHRNLKRRRGLTQSESVQMLSDMMDYDAGKLDEAQKLQLFSALIRTGLARMLKGGAENRYYMEARRLVDAGLLDEDGNILTQ